MKTQSIKVEIDVELSAHSVKTDYGVPGSPVWDEIESVEIDTAWMFGRDWTSDELKNEFGAGFVEYIRLEAEDGDWE